MIRKLKGIRFGADYTVPRGMSFAVKQTNETNYMRLNEIALNAVNKLYAQLRQTPMGNDNRISLRSAIERIRERWVDIVLVHGRYVYALEEDVISVNGNYHFLDDVSSCDCCDEYTVDTNSVYTRRSGRLTQQIWCEGCTGDNAFYCTGCDERFDDGECHSYEGESYCAECYENLERNELPAYHCAKRWHIPDYNIPLYSLELELESDERNELIEKLNDLAFRKVSWEMDGSLDRQKGMELLIQLRESTEQLSNDVSNLLANIKKKGLSLSSWNNKRCGIHLNSNRTLAWNKKNVMRLLYCVRMAKDSLVRISGRDCTQWASWDSRGHLLERQAEGSLGKYTMLRVGCDRFEWRMFRGTLNEKRIALYCETVKQFEDLALSETSIYHLKDKAIKLGIELSNQL